MADDGPRPGGVETRGTLTIAEYWHERLALHHEGRYAGQPMLKFPEDLRTYEELIWDSRPEVILELGSLGGGSTLWLRDRMATLHSYGGPEPRVVSVDIAIGQARKNLELADPRFAETITLLEGDVTSAATIERVLETVGDATCMVIEDTAHTFETTTAALSGFSMLVPEGGYFVVEDGCVDVEWMRPSADWPRGVQPAMDRWLLGDVGRDFVRRRDLEVYGFTCHPGGVLQRRTGLSPGEREMMETPAGTRGRG